MAEPVWWQETTIYQIYPRSFQDSNQDGIGDIPGIIRQLDYIKDLGFETIWLSPHYSSPQRDFGYDISDYYGVAPEYGTTEDVDRLINEVHERGMKIILDMILNHTSDQHPWFLESRSSRDNPKRDWYIWRDGRGKGKPPNNWKAIPGTSGWSYDAKTDQWYFHNFLGFQPDLNFRNPEVKQAMFDAMRYWLDKGADGYRLDIFHSIFKDGEFRDNPFSLKYVPTGDYNEGYFQKLENNLNRPETFELAKEVRSLLDEYNPPRFAVGEVFGKNVVKKYLGENLDGLNLILLFDLTDLHRVHARDLHQILEHYEKDYPAPYIPTFGLGNHDRRRYMTRIGGNVEVAKILALFQYTARGVPITYYGDELGIPDGDFPHGSALDPTGQAYWWIPRSVARAFQVYPNRDGCRTPMQWSGDPNAGFTDPEAKPWLPVHSDFTECNVSVQKENPYSLLNIHRKLLWLRREYGPLRRGSLQILPSSEDTVAYQRSHKEAGANTAEALFIALNPSGSEKRIPLPEDSSSSSILFRTHPDCTIENGTVTLPPYTGALTTV